MSDLQRRAEAFAALSDPARLRIVDLLTVGDLASSEIMAELDMPSNLVAFHLGVLEAKGVVRRSPSEGDGRRRYFRLIPAAFEKLAPDPIPVKGRVLFVCTANSARSQMAEAIWRTVSAIPAASAGTEPGDEVNPHAVTAAQRTGFPLAPDAHPKLLADTRQFGDFLISVCDRAHESLAGADDVHWSIPDPALDGRLKAFERTAGDLRARIEAVASRLVPAT
jgi:protein-tyrosine-phosphatase